MRLVPIWPLACAIAAAGGLSLPARAGTTAAMSLPPGRATATAEDVPLLIRAKRVIVAPGRELQGGAVLVRGGRIEQVGQGIAAPEGALEIEGDTVCAAFVDPWSALGLSLGVLTEAAPTASMRALDGFDPYAFEHIRQAALRAGVTTVRLQGAYREPVGGLSALVRVAPALARSESVLWEAGALGMSIGLSRPSSGQFEMMPDGNWAFMSGSRTMDPFDRLDQVERVGASLESGRGYLLDQVEYKHELEAWQKAIAEKEKELDKEFKKAKKDREKEQKDAKDKGKEFKEKSYKEDRKPKAPRYDEDREALARVVNGELPLVVEVHRTAEIRRLLEVTEPFDRVRLLIAGGTEAASCAAELAERRIPVIVWPSLRGTGDDDEYKGSGLSLAAELSAAGVQVLFGSGGREQAVTRDLPLLVAVAISHGFDSAKAFEAMTVGAARAFDLDRRIGTVEPGKEAELIVLSGEPLATTSRVTHVVSAGRLVLRPEN